MRLIDLTKKYTLVNQNRDLVINNVNEYIKEIPSIIEQLNTIWDDRDLQRVLSSELYDAKKIEEMREYCFEVYNSLTKKIQKKYPFLPIPDGFLVLGTSTSSGHAVRMGNDVYVFWMALEVYQSRKQIEIFLTHELFHAIHYKLNNSLYPETREFYYSTGRALLTEGLATYMTKETLSISDGDALWADFFDEAWVNKWIAYCKEHQNEHMTTAVNNYEKVFSGGVWFVSDGTDTFETNRIGYYIGLEIVKKLTKKYSIEELFQLSLKDVFEYIKKEEI